MVVVKTQLADRNWTAWLECRISFIMKRGNKHAETKSGFMRKADRIEAEECQIDRVVELSPVSSIVFA
jgi:hypothetical protein